MAVDHVVTLVHGTFAKRARWVRPDAFFSRTLRARFEDEAVAIDAFRWSGWNSPWARRAAARQLQAVLRRQAAEHPDARLAVVGHSHGGAVALKALEGDPGLRARCRVVTLATPFVQTRERSTSPLGFADTVLWLCLLPASAAVGLALGVWALALYDRSGAAALPLHWGAVALGSLGVLLAGRLAASGFLSLARSAQASLAVASPPPENLLVIRSAGDEATALLGTAQLLSWIVGRLWRTVGVLLRPAFWVLHRSARWGSWPPTFALLLLFSHLPLLGMAQAMGELGSVIASATLGEAPPPPDSFPIWLAKELWAAIRLAFLDPTIGSLGQALAACVLALGAAVATLPFVAWPALVLLGTALLPFGVETGLAALAVEVSVEAVPEGTWTLHQHAYPAEPEGSGLLSLAHSALYDDPEVIAQVASWLADRSWRRPSCRPPA